MTYTTRLYLVTKVFTENGKRIDRYLSGTGKWIKSRQHAGGMSKDMAEKIAAENAAVICPSPVFCGYYR